MPKFSIVTISFNQARFLEACLRSVIEQDYPAIEYIVVDPGSTDGSRDIIVSHRKELAHVIFQRDDGPADGLNKGFALATGDIYGFLNADDVLEPGALAQVAQWFERNPAFDVVSGHSWIIDEEGMKRRRFFSDTFSLHMAAYGASILAQQSTFFRCNIFEKAGRFNAENRTCWDGELYIDIALVRGRFNVVNKFWSGFRIHGKNISGRVAEDLQFRRDMARIAEKAIGRKINAFDRFTSVGARYLRKVLNPRDTIERLRRGSVLIIPFSVTLVWFSVHTPHSRTISTLLAG